MSGDLIYIEIEDDDAPAQCGNCDWKGKAGEVDEPRGAILSPGDPSPAGRCPDCGALGPTDLAARTL